MHSPRRQIIASHLILTGYAHWLPNDPRGSGSTSVRKEELQSIAPLLIGRQSPQPARQQVRAFFKDAEAKLEHPRIWFDDELRGSISDAFAEATEQFEYTIWLVQFARIMGIL